MSHIREAWFWLPEHCGMRQLLVNVVASHMSWPLRNQNSILVIFGDVFMSGFAKLRGSSIQWTYFDQWDRAVGLCVYHKHDKPHTTHECHASWVQTLRPQLEFSLASIETQLIECYAELEI